MIQEGVKLNIKGQEYDINFPNVGQFYQIESLKQTLSRGMYNSMILSQSGLTNHALDMIDIEASLIVLCPKLIQDLKVKNFNELSISDYKLIRDNYFEVVQPFFTEIQKMLNSKIAGNESIEK